ncbi:MAG: nuclear transport factor 2 family protein [Gammaproteobacteria bacterium]
MAIRLNNRSTAGTRRSVTCFVSGALATAVVGTAVQSFASQHTKPTDTNPYREIPADTIALVEAAEVAFMERDADGIRQHLDADFTWYQVNEEGAKETVKGREETIQLLSTFFDGDAWTESEVHRLGMLGNILVQVEVDTFVRDGEPVELETLSVYEFRDGRRWREWKFYPSAESPF